MLRRTTHSPMFAAALAGMALLGSALAGSAGASGTAGPGASGTAAAGASGTAAAETAAAGTGAAERAADRPVGVEIVAPRPKDLVGTGGRAWMVDLRVTYTGRDPLTKAGFVPQLTGPGVHASAAPFPGTFSPGRDDALPGLVVLSSTATLPTGPGTNLANLFNLTALTDNRPFKASIMDTWIVGAALFGSGTPSTLTVAVVDDLDHNGVYDDAPATVADSDGDGDVDRSDLAAIGLASNVDVVRFTVTEIP